MIRTFAIVCLLAASAFGYWESGFKVRWGQDESEYGKTEFIQKPETITEANEMGWIPMLDAPRAAGYESLTPMYDESDPTFAVLFDGSGYAAGFQIALNSNNFYGNEFDWSASGFKNCTVNVNGTSVTYYTIRAYFLSPDDAQALPANLVVQRNSLYLLQHDYIYLEDGEELLHKVPATYEGLITGSIYTEQGCMDGMGMHYYYNMTEETVCNVESISRWFLLEDGEQVIGIGFSIPGNCPAIGNQLNMENPSRSPLQKTVPNGPECLYAYGDSGMCMLHIYFIDTPYKITC